MIESILNLQSKKGNGNHRRWDEAITVIRPIRQGQGTSCELVRKRWKALDLRQEHQPGS